MMLSRKLSLKMCQIYIFEFDWFRTGHDDILNAKISEKFRIWPFYKKKFPKMFKLIIYIYLQMYWANS